MYAQSSSTYPAYRAEPLERKPYIISKPVVRILLQSSTYPPPHRAEPLGIHIIHTTYVIHASGLKQYYSILFSCSCFAALIIGRRRRQSSRVPFMDCVLCPCSLAWRIDILLWRNPPECALSCGVGYLNTWKYYRRSIQAFFIDWRLASVCCYWPFLAP